MQHKQWILNTYSIIAIDKATGDLGLASASCALAVGGAIAYSRLGVGVVNTQHHADLRLGATALNRINQGIHPEQAIIEALHDDPRAEFRQLIAMDTHNRKGAWTGSKCTGARSHEYGDNCVAAGNNLVKSQVIKSMISCFEQNDDKCNASFSERLLKTLETAEKHGGDKRGRQSAAIKIMPSSLANADEINCDLRVDDNKEPLLELKRLLKLFEETYR